MSLITNSFPERNQPAEFARVMPGASLSILRSQQFSDELEHLNRRTVASFIVEGI